MTSEQQILIDRIRIMLRPSLQLTCGHIGVYCATINANYYMSDLCEMVARREKEGYGKCKVCQELRPIAEEAIAINRLEASVQ